MCSKCAALREFGLEAGATDAEIKAAHRLYVKAWHPDRFPGDEKSRCAAQEKLKAINSAYELLTSPSSRTGPSTPPRTATQSAQPQGSAHNEQATPQPPRAGWRRRGPIPKENTAGQASAKAPNPAPSTARHLGWLLYLVPVLFLVAWGLISNSSNRSAPQRNFAEESTPPIQPLRETTRPEQAASLSPPDTRLNDTQNSGPTRGRIPSRPP